LLEKKRERSERRAAKNHLVRVFRVTVITAADGRGLVNCIGILLVDGIGILLGDIIGVLLGDILGVLVALLSSG
jgi:hypothetical protein